MNLQQAEEIYKRPVGHSKEELTACLNVLNSYHRLTVAEQVVIADAEQRRDILEGVIDVEYRIVNEAEVVEFFLS